MTKGIVVGKRAIGIALYSHYVTWHEDALEATDPDSRLLSYMPYIPSLQE